VHRDTGLSEALSGAESAHDHEGHPSGYEARHSLTIRCGDLAEAGALVTALAADVGHRLQVERVSLVVADTTDTARVARERAFADARSRGEHLAGLAGEALGDVQAISDGAGTSPPMPFAGDLRAAKAEASFEPGETAVSASLTVVFELAPAG